MAPEWALAAGPWVDHPDLGSSCVKYEFLQLLVQFNVQRRRQCSPWSHYCRNHRRGKGPFFGFIQEPLYVCVHGEIMKLRNSGNGEWERVTSSKPNVSILWQKQECGKMRSRCDSLREAGEGREEEEAEGRRGRRAKYSTTLQTHTNLMMQPIHFVV